MNELFQQINTQVYKPLGLEISEFKIENEGQEYNASRFKVNGRSVICRNGKITPKKTGQFVTFWKRNTKGISAPFDEIDDFELYVINVTNTTQLGQFVFPKWVLIKQGIVSTLNKEGKRGFRVYPNWDIAKNKQAQRTQKWQLDYFYCINSPIDLTKASQLYKK